MSDLAFRTQEPEKIAPVVLKRLRKELGAGWPIPSTIERGPDGASETIFVVTFDCAGPRPFQLHAHVDRQGVGARVGALRYSATLAKNIAGEIELQAPRMVGDAVFAGDPPTAARLNARAALIKRANRFSCVQSNLGGLAVTIPRYFKILPRDGGAILVAIRLGAPRLFGFGLSLGAKEFTALATEMEAAL